MRALFPKAPCFEWAMEVEEVVIEPVSEGGGGEMIRVCGQGKHMVETGCTQRL